MTRTILIADDDYDNRMIVKQALERANYAVMEATNGLEAVDMVSKNFPDLVLMDLTMPKLNGWDAAKRIRENPQTSHIPIVAFTAHALVGEYERAKAAGCDDYIAKPCHPKDLVMKVANWFRTEEEEAHA